MQEIGISLYEIFDCLVLFFYLFQEREREREVFRGRENENPETSEGFFLGGLWA